MASEPRIHEVVKDLKVPDQMEYRRMSTRKAKRADLYGGFLKAALWPAGQFSLVEPAYLLTVWHQIRNSNSCAVPLGIMSMPNCDLLRKEPWFPCRC